MISKLKMANRVLILTEAGKRTGLGHIARCAALSQGIGKECPDAKIRFAVCGDGTSKDFFVSHKIDVIENDWRKELKRDLRLLRDYDFVIIDSYMAEKPIYDGISEKTRGRVLMVDDYNRIEYPDGIVVNPSVGAKELRYPKKSGVTYLLGGGYTILRREFWSVPGKHIRNKIKNILITLGGGGCHDALARKIADFVRCKFGVTPIFPGAGVSRISAKDMLRLMLKADICISAGGQTTNELAICGVPTIGICFAGNQILNLRGWERAGFLNFAGWYHDKNILRNIGMALTGLNYERRIGMSMAGKSGVRGSGAVKIAQEILSRIS